MYYVNNIKVLQDYKKIRFVFEIRLFFNILDDWSDEILTRIVCTFGNYSRQYFVDK